MSDSDEEEERGVDEGQAGAGGFVVDEWVQCESCSKWRRLPGKPAREVGAGAVSRESVSSTDQVESKVWAALKLPGEGDWDAMRFPPREQLDGFECFLHHD